EYDGFLTKRHAELTTQLRTSKKIAMYLLAVDKAAQAAKAAKLATTQPKQYAIRDDGKGTKPFVVNRWQAYLKTAQAKNDSIFRLWRIFDAPGEAVSFGAFNPLVLEEIAAKPPQSIDELAECYGAVLAKFDRVEAFANADEEA